MPPRMLGNSRGCPRVKQAECDQKPQDGAIRHHPADARDDDDAEHGGGDQAIFHSHGIVEPLPDRPQLQPDQHERQHVQDEDGGVPHRVGRHPQPRRRLCGRGSRDGDGIGDDGQDSGQAETLGDDPHREGARELHDDRARRIGDAPGQRHRNPGEQKAGDETTRQRQDDRRRELAPSEMLDRGGANGNAVDQ